jgi:hypothetical protein
MAAQYGTRPPRAWLVVLVVVVVVVAHGIRL